ncbi:V-type ATP synthase subunit I [Nitrosococcus watsonii]|uniref:V-type ATPase 116 kDa subunit n=1 Tax=Nitrosococcus watsoni (strain C-113) TaxID=105559 RepID=D8K4W6_NITWC|nr:V-type ATPase 116kDa subunit family protein [Nitrosococcus watsonii]ADJ27943.1 V-type ATPase 116 kDa subunit [Nitrosococcus watsonii C-113]
MLASLSMRRVILHMVTEEAPEAALGLAESGVFSPEPLPAGEESLPECPATSYQALFHDAQMRLQKVSEYLGVQAAIPPEKVRAISESELAAFNKWLGRLWRRCSQLQEKGRELDEKILAISQLDTSLDTYARLDVNLGLLQGELRFLDVRLGAVPQSNFGKLQEAVGMAGYILKPFAESDSAALVVLAGVKGHERQVQSVLRAAAYRPLQLPAEFQHHPQQVRQQLAAQRQRFQEERLALAQERELLHKKHAQALHKGAQRLILAAPYAFLSASLRSQGGLAMVQGWAPTEKISFLRKILQRRLAQRFVLTTREPTSDERLMTPSLIRVPHWLQPFTDLAHNYGVPRYGELDPSWLFALTFIAMFGMMFGDVGHGVVILAVGWGCRRRLGHYTPFVLSLGVSSCCFGFLYGSVFGYEEILSPLWISPLSNPQRMLMVALLWGVGFILLATAIGIRNRLAEGRYAEALLGGRGLAGSLVYLGAVYGAFRWMEEDVFGAMEAAAAILPFLVLVGYHWHQAQVPGFGRGVVVLIESFEIIMGYFANTLSFLRVAAFSLNHVALALAVFALAGTMEAVGHWVTVVVGNLFILILEGAIVAIQVLRLEYYEGFSRFFSGDGRAFEPLILGPLK